MGNILIPTLIVGGIGALLGLILAIASKVFHVDLDTRIEQVFSMLPGYNCGACGYPGCQGMANALVEGDTDTISQCKPSNQTQRTAILEYLKNTPGPDGSVRDSVHI